MTLSKYLVVNVHVSQKRQMAAFCGYSLPADFFFCAFALFSHDRIHGISVRILKKSQSLSQSESRPSRYDLVKLPSTVIFSCRQLASLPTPCNVTVLHFIPYIRRQVSCLDTISDVNELGFHISHPGRVTSHVCGCFWLSWQDNGSTHCFCCNVAMFCCNY